MPHNEQEKSKDKKKTYQSFLSRKKCIKRNFANFAVLQSRGNHEHFLQLLSASSLSELTGLFCKHLWYNIFKSLKHLELPRVSQ